MRVAEVLIPKTAVVEKAHKERALDEKVSKSFIVLYDEFYREVAKDGDR